MIEHELSKILAHTITNYHFSRLHVLLLLQIFHVDLMFSQFVNRGRLNSLVI